MVTVSTLWRRAVHQVERSHAAARRIEPINMDGHVGAGSVIPCTIFYRLLAQASVMRSRLRGIDRQANEYVQPRRCRPKGSATLHHTCELAFFQL
jgi:hypothetical protein